MHRRARHAGATARRSRVRHLHASKAKRHARPRRRPAALRTVGGIDALIALQGIEDPAERRRKAVKRGRALDALDELKLGLLAGTLDHRPLAAAQVGRGRVSKATGDPRLDTVMAEIDLRVEVELAKIGMADRRAINRPIAPRIFGPLLRAKNWLYERMHFDGVGCRHRTL